MRLIPVGSCLASMLISGLAAGVRADDVTDGSLVMDPGDVPVLPSTNVNVAYRLAKRSQSPKSAELWVTKDRSRSWALEKKVAGDSKAIQYEASGDGLYGFYVVLVNEFGASSPPPRPGTPPTQWVRVDREKPRVQLLALQADPHFDLNREVLIRWSSEDENPIARPVALHYRTESTRTYLLIADCLPAGGSFRWTAPIDVVSRVDIKVSATDAAGRSGHYVSDSLRLDARRGGAGDHHANAAAGEPIVPNQESVDGNGGVARSEARSSPTRLVSPGDAKAAMHSYETGTWHRLRGEYGEAIARFRDALEADPRLLAARNDLAGLLLLRGDAESAKNEYLAILEEDAGHRAALKGLALVYVRMHNHTEARQALIALLKAEPRNAEAWLNLGDVALFMGDAEGAREAWRNAGDFSTDAKLARRVERRLTSGMGQVRVAQPQRTMAPSPG